MEKITALTFERETTEVTPGELAPAEAVVIRVELSNGRTLTVDKDGVMDTQDIDGEGCGRPGFDYLTWRELLTALDSFRAGSLN